MSVTEKMQHLLDNLTKPKGSLGDLEAFALRMAAIQDMAPPVIKKTLNIVCAADHGVTGEGISLYPSEVTAQMVLNMVNGGAAANVLARHCGSDVWIVDAGVAAKLENASVIDMKIAPGTANFARQEAMTREQLELCLSRGKDLADRAADEGYQLISLGDMGIGNTTTAAALLAAGGIPVDEVVDRGTGIDDETLEHKRQVIVDALEKHSPFADVHDIMMRLGGFEICMMAGIILGLKGRKIACVIDGFPVTAGAYCAWLADPAVKEYLFAGHKSKVKGHAVVLEKMGLPPIVDLGMRLGEGTGAIIGGFLIKLAAQIAGEMASFESADVSRSDDEELDY